MRPLQPAPSGKIPFAAASEHFMAGGSALAAQRATADAAPLPGQSLNNQLRHECDAMARHALQHGLTVAPELIARLAALLAQEASADTADDGFDRYARELAIIHARLAQIVAPSTPQGIALLDTHRRSPHGAALLGPVPLIRMLTLTALGFLAAVVASGLSAEVSGENLQRGMLDSSGSTLLFNLIFLLCCAGLGASFATLFHAHRYIANSTYDPKFDASYGARLILGVIAGLILVEMLPPHLFASGDANGFGKPAMAMLGGFSASAVHRLLQRLVDTLESLVRGDPAAQVHAALASQRAHAASERLHAQGDFAQRLFTLQRMLDSSMPLDAVRLQLAELTQTMLTGDAARGTSGLTAIPGEPGSPSAGVNTTPPTI
jgi:hypothetical protein